MSLTTISHERGQTLTLQGKVALIAVAASGMGKEIALEYAKPGARIVI